MSTTATLCFRVDFSGMTERCREFWAEGKYEHAYKVLEEGFNLSRDQATSVIKGEMKLADDPDGHPGIDGMLLSDSWKPCDSGFGFYPEAGNPLATAEIVRLKKENDAMRRELVANGIAWEESAEEYTGKIDRLQNELLKARTTVAAVNVTEFIKNRCPLMIVRHQNRIVNTRRITGGSCATA